MSTDTTVSTARSQTLGDLLRRTAARYPDKTALVDGETTLTYTELNATVNRIAASIGELGLRKGDRLAILSHNCWEFVALSYATARLGVLLVPINFMLNSDEIAFIIAHSGAKGFVVEDALLDTASAAIDAAGTEVSVRGVIGATAPGWQNVADWASSGEVSAPDVFVGDDDPIRIMYTSGTESRPKGVLLSSKSLISQYVSCVIDGSMESSDIEIHSLPLYHCAQLDCFLNTDIYLGATSVILSGAEPGGLLRAVEQHRATKLFCPPTVWISLLRHPDFDSTDLSSLRKGYYGASPMPVEVLNELRRRLPAVRLWNFYGQTELSPVATILGPEDQVARAGSAGRPSLNVETIVIDDDGQPVPAGEVGEIVHRSPHATLGYYHDEAKTAEAFRGGWFHSGDLGIMDDDGYLSVVDRKKDMIKTGGENVASREVEEHLYTLDGVAEVAVFGVPHPHWIEAVTAVVVPAPGATLTEDEVRAHAATKLAGYKQPKFVVLASELPKNPSGKIVKRALRERFGDLADR